MRSQAVMRWGLVPVIGAALLTALTVATAQEAADAPPEDEADRPVTRSTGRLMEALGLSWPAASPAAMTQAGDGAPDVRLSRPGTFEIHVQGADLRGVLQLLSTQGRKNIVATKEVSGTVTADLYGVTFTEALEAVLKASGFVYREKDGFIYVYTPQQLQEILKSERQMGQRVFRLAYITAADANALIAPVLSSEAKVSVTPAALTGVATSGTDAGGNSSAHNDILIIQDYEDNLDQIEAILTELDVCPDQILVEVTILSAKLEEENALGVNFSTLAGIDFETLDPASTDLGNMGRAGLSGSDLQHAPASTFRTDFSGTTSTTGGMTFGIVTNNVAAFITALETITDTTVLANPKLLILNKQRGEVLIGDRDGYITTTITEGVATQAVEFLETGTRLIVRPYVAKDGFIRLELHPEDSDGGVDATGLPSKTTAELTTNILVRDGRTVVLGGLFREETKTTRNQVPVLGNIPVIGAAFRYTDDVTKRKEIIVLLTPHIIKHAPDEAVSEQLKDDVERFRIGQRRGVRWWGRSRLAQTHLSWARQALTKGNRAMALWNVDMALSMTPTLEEAIRLKERLSGRPYWADHAQDSAIKYVIQRMIMHDLGKPVELVIPPGKPRGAADLDKAVQDAFGMDTRIELPLGEPLPSEKGAEEADIDRAVKLLEGRPDR